jgi:hypothetical protein
MLTTDEVEDRELLLGLVVAEPTPELLEKDRQALVGRRNSTVSISGMSTPSL